jgi:DnaJ-like protein
MAGLILGTFALVLALWALNVISKVDTRMGARILKAAGGLLAIGFAVFLGLRGEMAIALPLGMFGLGLLGWMPFGSNASILFGSNASIKGRVSRIRSTYLEIELDHDSGIIQGRFISGSHRGIELEKLDISTLISMLSTIDDESRALLIAYLDSRDARWREYAQGDAATGRRAAMSVKTTDEEAYQILGLEAGASAEAVVHAHRRLIKKLHPDQGGSTYLAARVNEAKEVLLRRHRYNSSKL